MVPDDRSDRSAGVQREYIGVDLGGTEVAAGVVRRGCAGPIEAQPTDTSSAKAPVEQLVTQIGDLRTPRASRAVGIGVPGLVDFRTGTIRFSINTPWTDCAATRAFRAARSAGLR
jgi:glucokinase